MTLVYKMWEIEMSKTKECLMYKTKKLKCLKTTDK